MKKDKINITYELIVFIKLGMDMEKIRKHLTLLEQPEIRRKAIHLSSILIPLIFSYISFSSFIILFFLIYGIWVYLDYQRRVNPTVQALLKKALGDVFRPEEAGSMSGATHMGLGILITCVFFEHKTAVMALTILAVCDTVASIVGSRYGHIKVADKSLEGAVGFFLSGLIVICLFVWGFGYKAIFLWENLFALAITTLAELYSKKLKINDNILIPVIFSISVALLESAA